MDKDNAVNNEDGALTIQIDINSRALVLFSVTSLVCAAALIFFANYRSASASLPFQEMTTWNDPRRYYLTTADFTGANADGTDENGAGVCASGYHFASLWEILDVSNLEYNPTLGKTSDDSGDGPPAMTTGWVRTGFSSDSNNTPGRANCGNWDSTSGSGTAIWLPDNWVDAASQKINVWNTDAYSCSLSFYVWCVQD